MQWNRWKTQARFAAGVLVLLTAGRSLAAEKKPWFRDVTAQMGIAYAQQGLVESPHCTFSSGAFCEPERMTGGAAVGDLDGDGDLDLFVTRYDDHDLLFCNRLAQTGEAGFEDCTEGSGLEHFFLQSNGAAWGDLDRDGDLDLYVGTLGDNDGVNNRSYLFINDGWGHFSEEAVSRGAAAPGELRRTWSVAIGDYDRDGWPDLHLTEWSPFGRSNGRLLRGTGGGYFEDTTEAAGLDFDLVNGFASSFADLDGDLWPELVVTGDFRSSRLFWNRGDGRFEDGTQAAGVGTDENGMGSALGDFDGDGDLDWFVTSIYDPDETCSVTPCNWGSSGNRLYRNEGGRSFSDVTDALGVRNGHWGWGSAFFDYDNDADPDLVMTNGVDFPGYDYETPFHDDPVRLWKNTGPGPWPETAAALGLADRGSGKGLLVWDYDADGDLDLLIVNTGSGARLYRNERGNENEWLRVRVLDPWGTDALGARVELREEDGGLLQAHQLGVATGFLGQSERVVHIGLGARPPRDLLLRVVWPDGSEREIGDLPLRTTVVVRGSPAVPLGVPRGLLLGMLILGAVRQGSARIAARQKRHFDTPRTE